MERLLRFCSQSGHLDVHQIGQIATSLDQPNASIWGKTKILSRELLQLAIQTIPIKSVETVWSARPSLPRWSIERPFLWVFVGRLYDDSK